MGEVTVPEMEAILKEMKEIEIAAENGLEFVEKGTGDSNKCPTPGGEGNEAEKLIKDLRIGEAAAEFETDAAEIANACRNDCKSPILEYPHIPHDALTGGGATAYLGPTMYNISQVAGPLSIAATVATTGYAAYEDYEYGTSRNTVETLSAVGGGLLAGHGGALGGAALGTAFFPGVGTIVGGVIGAIGAGIGGALTTGHFAKKVGDSYGYNLVEKRCKKCGKTFKIRRYLGQTDLEFCKQCCEEILKEKRRLDAELQEEQEEEQDAPSKQQTKKDNGIIEERKKEDTGLQEDKQEDAALQAGNDKDAPSEQDVKRDTELLDEKKEHISPPSEENNAKVE